MTDVTPAQIRPLTSIRGFAALWVYMHHGRNMDAGHGLLKAFVDTGNYGVDVFFILSGFIINHIYREDFASWQDVKKNYLRFLTIRFWRIYPLHLVTLLVWVILPIQLIWETEAPTVGDFLRNLFMVHSWVGFSDVMHWNVPSWSVSVEWLLYILFPFAVWLLRARAKDKLFNAGLFVLTACAWVGYLYCVDVDMAHLAAPGYAVGRGLLDFTLGLALNNLFRMGFLEKLPWDALSIVCILGFFCVLWVKTLNKEVYDIVILLLAAVTIYALANIKTYGHLLFSNAAVVYLGTVSYSIYMWHWYYMQITWKYRDVLFHEEAFFSFGFLIKTVGLIMVSALSYHFIENPARKWGLKQAKSAAH